MKLLGYVRVSTTNQANGFSLESQKESIENYCKLYGHEVIQFYQDKNSGAFINNGLKKLLKELTKQTLDGIIVDKLDRLFRNTEELLKTVRVIKDNGKVLISVKEQFDITTISGQLSLTVISAFAEFEKSRIRERIITGKTAKKQAGGFIGGTVPFGYSSEKIINSEGKEIKILVENDSEQAVIQLSKELRTLGKSFSSIAKLLNEQGYRTKRKKKFTATQVFRICR